jgi:hypothetical protein
MPRKQRFKPSRKPKPVEPAQEQRNETSTPSYNPNTEPTRPYANDSPEIEGNQPVRTQTGSAAVIED